MEQVECIGKTGRSILERMHQHYIKASLDDTEFIPLVKAVIEGVEDQLAAVRCSKDKRDDIRGTLKQYCKELYVAGWVKNREEGESAAEARERGAKYFDYPFKYGRHPSGK